MIIDTINAEPFKLGFILGTSVYAVIGGMAYFLFLAGKQLLKSGAGQQRPSVPPRRRLELVR